MLVKRVRSGNYSYSDLDVVNGGENKVAIKNISKAEYPNCYERRQYDQLSNRIEKLCIELECIKDQMEQKRDITGNYYKNTDEEETIWIGCIEC
ncbi:hypothetical protein ACFLVY_00555 [Chloroflexota bacterium]